MRTDNALGSGITPSLTEPYRSTLDRTTKRMRLPLRYVTVGLGLLILGLILTIPAPPGPPPSATGFWLRQQQTVAPLWFTLLEWGVLLYTLTLATVWVCRRWSRLHNPPEEVERHRRVVTATIDAPEGDVGQREGAR